MRPEAERDEHALLSLTDTLRLPAQDTTSVLEHQAASLSLKKCDIVSPKASSFRAKSRAENGGMQGRSLLSAPQGFAKWMEDVGDPILRYVRPPSLLQKFLLQRMEA